MGMNGGELVGLAECFCLRSTRHEDLLHRKGYRAAGTRHHPSRFTIWSSRDGTVLRTGVGAVIRSTADVDGDGASDLAVVHKGVALLSSSREEALWRSSGHSRHGHGFLEIVGDIDGDGVADFAARPVDPDRHGPVRLLSGRQPEVYHNDHSRPESPKIRTLADEIGRVVRARVVNPKWIAGVMRHGYKGAFEMAATVDYLFAFAATARAVEDHHFDLVYEAYLDDEAVRDFLEQNNAAALKEMAERLLEAQTRGLWRPRSNSAHARLSGWAGKALEKAS